MTASVHVSARDGRHDTFSCLSLTRLQFSDAFDIHISKRDRITIIDFNHSGESTNPLLYTWEELLHASGEAELRLCDSEDSRRTVPEKSIYGFPVDFNRLGDVLNSKDTDLFT